MNTPRKQKTANKVKEIPLYNIKCERIEKSEIVGFSFARKTTIVRRNNQPVNHSYTSHILHYLSKAIYTSQRIIRLVAFMRHLSSYFYKALALARLSFTGITAAAAVVAIIIIETERPTIRVDKQHFPDGSKSSLIEPRSS
uniref:Uncharacterized protein n=1 Tax=Trichogramma kaykai TaxID=54128 RepID=A0ABD2W0E9_9HYME